MTIIGPYLYPINIACQPSKSMHHIHNLALGLRSTSCTMLGVQGSWFLSLINFLNLDFHIRHLALYVGCPIVMQRSMVCNWSHTCTQLSLPPLLVRIGVYMCRIRSHLFHHKYHHYKSRIFRIKYSSKNLYTSIILYDNMALMHSLHHISILSNTWRYIKCVIYMAVSDL